MARLLFTKDQPGKLNEAELDIPEPVLDPTGVGAVGDPVGDTYPIDSGYQLEDGEDWNDDDADIGMAYVEPLTYDETPDELSPADNLLGAMPDPADDFGSDDLISDPLSMGFDDDDGDDFIGEPLYVTEAFRLPGTGMIVNVGDRIHMVKAESAKFVTRESADASFKAPALVEASDPDAMLRKMAYGESEDGDEDDEDKKSEAYMVDQDDEDNGLVVDTTQGLAYAEARVAFHLPGTEGPGKIVFEKGDRLLIVGKVNRVSEDETKKDDDEDEDDKKSEGEVPDSFKKNWKKDGDDKDDDEEKDDKKKDKKDESQGLVSRKTSRRLGYSLRQQPDGKTWSTPGATGATGRPGSI